VWGEFAGKSIVESDEESRATNEHEFTRIKKSYLVVVVRCFVFPGSTLLLGRKHQKLQAANAANERV